MALSEVFQTQKVELFNWWLDSGRDWDKVQMIVKRVAEGRNTSTKGWHAVQGKQLRTQLTQEKFDKLVASRMQSGLYYQDEDFPDDTDESSLSIDVSVLIQ